jgi:hypothetical protein
MSVYTVDVIPEVSPQPTEPLTNAQYIDWVVNRAAESYQTQYGAASKEAGITAAREAFNASIPAPVVEEAA